MSDSNSTPLTLLDLRKGSTLDYEMKNWKAIGEYNYRWADGRFSREFKLSAASQVVFLEMEDQEDDFPILVSKKISRNAEIDTVITAIKRNSPPETMTYSGRSYRLKEKNIGEWRDRHGYEDWESFEVWDFYDESDKYFLSIERWEGSDFEIYAGHREIQSAFSNITKPKKAIAGTGLLSWLGNNISIILFAGFFSFMLLPSMCSSNRQNSQYYDSNGNYTTTDSTNTRSSRGGGVYIRTPRSGNRTTGRSSRSRGGGGGK